MAQHSTGQCQLCAEELLLLLHFMRLGKCNCRSEDLSLVICPCSRLCHCKCKQNNCHYCEGKQDNCDCEVGQ